MFSDHRIFTFIGLTLTIIGLLFISIPFLVRHLPSIERIPPLILYVYKRGNFYFATSPILIIISIASILWFMFTRYR